MIKRGIKAGVEMGIAIIVANLVIIGLSNAIDKTKKVMKEKK